MIYRLSKSRSKPNGTTWQTIHLRIRTLVDRARSISFWEWKYSLRSCVRAGGMGPLALHQHSKQISDGSLPVELIQMSLICQCSHTTPSLTMVMVCYASFGKLRSHRLSSPASPPRNELSSSTLRITTLVILRVASSFLCPRNLRQNPLIGESRFQAVRRHKSSV